MELFGIGIEVYLVILLIGLIIYFPIKELLNKIKIFKKYNSALTWLSVIILSPLSYFLITYSFILFATSYPHREFNIESWNDNPEKRYEMSENIIDSEILIGKTKSEILELLGSEPYKYNENHWAYSLGFLPGYFNIDIDVLDIYFENEKVIRVSQHNT